MCKGSVQSQSSEAPLYGEHELERLWAWGYWAQRRRLRCRATPTRKDGTPSPLPQFSFQNQAAGRCLCAGLCTVGQLGATTARHPGWEARFPEAPSPHSSRLPVRGACTRSGVPSDNAVTPLLGGWWTSSPRAPTAQPPSVGRLPGSWIFPAPLASAPGLQAPVFCDCLPLSLAAALLAYPSSQLPPRLWGP